MLSKGYTFDHMVAKKRRKTVLKDKGILIHVTETQKETLAKAT